VQSDGTLVDNAGSWTEIGNLLFIDNPIGTGYSFTRPDAFAAELDEVAAYIVAFLENYFDIFPHYADNDVSQDLLKFCRSLYS
jgi:carboxypeptidase D